MDAWMDQLTSSYRGEHSYGVSRPNNHYRAQTLINRLMSKPQFASEASATAYGCKVVKRRPLSSVIPHRER